jgi:hypothetical protein
MLSDFVNACNFSFSEMRLEISKVRYREDGIGFIFRGEEYTGELKGRNADLILGVSSDIDAGIALRVLLDGHAKSADREEIANLARVEIDHFD